MRYVRLIGFFCSLVNSIYTSAPVSPRDVMLATESEDIALPHVPVVSAAEAGSNSLSLSGSNEWEIRSTPREVQMINMDHLPNTFGEYQRGQLYTPRTNRFENEGAAEAVTARGIITNTGVIVLGSFTDQNNQNLEVHSTPVIINPAITIDIQTEVAYQPKVIQEKRNFWTKLFEYCCCCCL